MAQSCSRLTKANEPGSVDSLLPLALKVGEVNLSCMAMLDAANTSTFGTPEPTTVTLDVEPGPFIVVTGHDLYDLKLLLEQTEGKGVNVYTHSEMLPAHAYPELKKCAQGRCPTFPAIADTSFLAVSRLAIQSSSVSIPILAQRPQDVGSKRQPSD